MNGRHNRGVLLLEDLEDEDEDFEYQANYSNSTSNNDTVLFNNYKNTNTHKHNNVVKVNSTSNLLQVPSNPNLMVTNGGSGKHQSQVEVERNGYMNGFTTRRKSVSAEPPFEYDKYDKNKAYPTREIPYEDMNGINNAITVAPSRTSLQEPNVFTGGRINPNSPNNTKNHHHHKKHNHRKHKGRSKSPNGEELISVGGGSILDKIDNSILKNFGDWSTMEDDKPRNMDNNNFRSNNNSKRVPYYIPKRMGSLEEQDYGFDGGVGGGVNGNLPKLFKNYDTVVQNAKQVLTDKSFKIAVSKDNNDPNSILSEAKRTLSRFGGNNVA